MAKAQPESLATQSRVKTQTLGSGGRKALSCGFDLRSFGDGRPYSEGSAYEFGSAI